jgi:hypothetical protein
MDSSQYFYRNVIFSKQGNTVSLVDIFNPDNEKQVLESWLGLVLQFADGQHTIKQLFEYLSGRYDGSPPENLEKTLHSAVGRLAGSKLIVLTKEAIELPYYLSSPIEKLDLEKAKELIKKDRPEFG